MGLDKILSSQATTPRQDESVEQPVSSREANDSKSRELGISEVNNIFSDGSREFNPNLMRKILDEHNVSMDEPQIRVSVIDAIVNQSLRGNFEEASQCISVFHLSIDDPELKAFKDGVINRINSLHISDREPPIDLFHLSIDDPQIRDALVAKFRQILPGVGPEPLPGYLNSLHLSVDDPEVKEVVKEMVKESLSKGGFYYEMLYIEMFNLSVDDPQIREGAISAISQGRTFEDDLKEFSKFHLSIDDPEIKKAAVAGTKILLSEVDIDTALKYVALYHLSIDDPELKEVKDASLHSEAKNELS